MPFVMNRPSGFFRRTKCLALVVLAPFFLPAPRSASAEPDERPLWLVVTRPSLAEAIAPLAERRREEGFETVVSTKPVGEAIASAKRRPAFILLVGDDEPGAEQQPWYLPGKRMKLYRWHRAQREEFTSDAAWGDFDGDLVPDAPVGRIPARTPEQARLVAEKIVAFEKIPPALHDLRVLCWGGSPEYGAVIDAMANQLYFAAVTINAPRWAQPWVIFADPTSPFCGWPPDQPAVFLSQFKRGCMLAVLMGHASADSFHSMTFANREVEFTARDAKAALAAGPPGAPMVFMSCDSGNFAGSEQCLAESLLMMPGGPAAAVGATTESHPLTNYFSGICLLHGLGGRNRRLGSVWLGAQKRAMKARDPLIERLLRDVEGKLEENIDVDKLRRDQILMYALLGDPATQLKLPGRLKVSATQRGDRRHWQAARPEGATELHVGFLPARQVLPRVEAPLKMAAARKQLREANNIFAFQSLPSLPAGRPWEGIMNREGTLRLVANAGGRLYVATVRLRTPASRPAPRSVPSSETPDSDP